MIETDDNESYEVFLGKAFLKLAGVSGGYYFSNEKKLGTGSVNEVLLSPRFVYVWMNGSAAFPHDLLSEFMDKYKGMFSSEYQLTIDNFQCVVSPDEIISKYGLDKLHGKDGESLKEGDVLVRIELKRKSHEEEVEADTINELFSGIKNALRELKCSDIPFTYSGKSGNFHEFVFFSASRDILEALHEKINASLVLPSWEMNKSSKPNGMQKLDNVYSCNYYFVYCPKSQA